MQYVDRGVRVAFDHFRKLLAERRAGAVEASRVRLRDGCLSASLYLIAVRVVIEVGADGHRLHVGSRGPSRTIDRKTNRLTIAKAIIPSVVHDCLSQLNSVWLKSGGAGSWIGISWKVVTLTSSAALAALSREGSSWAT